ncbi:MAG: RagB/SusD family nutrient uptake outer membrane protein [Odoribacteraceae bacterium]|jgi:hypothetical protein|nr:RagB/SusD family nutrient uptake outer membrane protein [Odoribacteraceae bacterium]
MKYKYLPLLLLFALPGCSGWLDIRPQLEIVEEDMFATEWGFQDVLIGAYSKISTQSMYGMYTSILVPELLAHHWLVASSNVEYDNIQNFNMDNPDLDGLLATIWQQYYQTIANLNSLLAAIDSRASLFVDGNYELIKGEALGLRAFLHFDLLRFWGDAPGVASGESITIPYMKITTKDPELLRSVSYDEVARQIKNDLDSAEIFLQRDPILLYPPGVLNSPGKLYANGVFPPDNSFHYYRQNRFNLHAVKATKARYHLWKGEKALALQHAREVIEAVDAMTSTPLFTLANEASMTGINASAPDLIMTSEHVFAIHNSALQSLLSSYFLSFGGLTQDRVAIRTAFETNIHPNDIRAKEPRNWEEKLNSQTQQKEYFFRKYLASETNTVQVIPIIRLAEMYLIAIECAALPEANEWLREFRISRNMESLIDGSLVDASSVYRFLEKEYRKEFYGEGQMFFFYKRNNVTTYSWPTAFPVDLTRYKFPRPIDQIIYE